MASTLADALQTIVHGILSLPIAIRGDVLNRTDQIEETAAWLREVAQEIKGWRKD